MSRAFVRELDTELPGDLPERPISPHPNRVTQAGLGQLKARLQAVEQALGAVSEGGVGSLLERAGLEREQRWLQARIGSAIVVAPPSDPSRAGFGACVALADDEGREYRYRIVGEDEAAPEQGKISWVSPLARALDGARAGDEVLWPRPAGDLRVEVRAVTYPES